MTPRGKFWPCGARLLPRAIGARPFLFCYAARHWRAAILLCGLTVWRSDGLAV
jgi:hypothetical protein